MTDGPKKRALITGASRGIGRVTAIELAKRGYDLTLVVRDRARGDAVAAEAKSAAPGRDVELLLGDLSSMKDVARIGKEFLGKHDRLDALVNNAGGLFMERQTTKDGFEMTLATNHLAYFVLTNALRPALERAAPSRVVVVASEAHRRAQIPWDDLMHEKSYSGFGAYGQSKLANILFARELSKRLEGTKVTANSLHPGFVATNFGRENKGIMRFVLPIAFLFALSDEDGAKTQIWAATSEECAGVTGKYFDKCRESTPSAAARSDEDAARLWKVTEELLAKAGVGT